METKTAQAFKVILRDAARGRHRQVGEGKHKLFVAVFQISTISSCTYYLIMVVVMVVFMHYRSVPYSGQSYVPLL